MARPKATQEQRDEIRRGIFDAAAEIYRVQGIDAISARAVALKAGVSVGTIYTYFGDLPTLMQALWSERLGRQDVDFRSLIESRADAPARLKALMLAYLKFGYENAALYRAAFFPTKTGQDLRAGSAPLSETAFPTLLAETLIACQAKGVVRDGDPALLAQIIWSGLHGCLALPSHIDRSAFLSAEALAEPMVEALLRAVEAPR